MSTEIKTTVDYSSSNFALKPYTNLGNYKALDQAGKDQFNKLTTENNEIKKQALNFIIKAIKDKGLDNTEAIKGAIAAVSRVKGNRGTGAAKAAQPKKSDILDTIFVKIGDSKSGLDIYKATKMGESNMRMACQKLKEATGKVVSYNAETELYTLTAINPIELKKDESPKDQASTPADDNELEFDLTDDDITL